MIKLILQKELTLIRIINQENVWFISYGPFTCVGCYNIVQRSTNFKNIAIVRVKNNISREFTKILVNIKQKS